MKSEYLENISNAREDAKLIIDYHTLEEAIPIQLKNKLSLFALALLSTTFLSACGDSPEAAKPTEQEAPLVETVTVKQIGLWYSIESSGFVRSPDQVELVAEVSGKVEETAETLQPGKNVKKGDMLVRIEQETYKAQVQQAKGAVASARTNLNNAKTDQERYEQLADRNVASEVRLDEAKTQLASAQANLANASAELTLAEEALDNTIIRAPFDALVAEESVSIGMFLSTGQAVATLINDNDIEITLGIESDAASAIEEALKEKGNQSVELFVKNSEQKLAANDVYMAPVVDAETRTVNFLVRFKDVDLQDNALMVGQYATVSFPAKAKQELFEVPAAAVRKNSYVFTVDSNNKLKKHSVDVIRVQQEKILFAIQPDSELPNTTLDKVVLTRLPNESNSIEVQAKHQQETKGS